RAQLAVTAAGCKLEPDRPLGRGDVTGRSGGHKMDISQEQEQYQYSRGRSPVSSDVGMPHRTARHRLSVHEPRNFVSFDPSVIATTV
ncbi:hypothetical protein J6590_107440, partial [Homalodisca vitripennis]